MRSESAAAIAVMRSATSASLAADDTESLLSNEFTNVDTEVVFKHRTVLQATQLSRVDLRHSLISSRGIHTLKNQPIVELAMKCHWNCLPVINSLHKTLRSLRLEKDDSIDNLLSNGFELKTQGISTV
nr:hypothetical protein BaRGS_011426 [Batillaria attramentaria]